jgi:hypothetical protein
MQRSTAHEDRMIRTPHARCEWCDGTGRSAGRDRTGAPVDCDVCDGQRLVTLYDYITEVAHDA